MALFCSIIFEKFWRFWGYKEVAGFWATVWVTEGTGLTGTPKEGIIPNPDFSRDP